MIAKILDLDVVSEIFALVSIKHYMKLVKHFLVIFFLNLSCKKRLIKIHVACVESWPISMENDDDNNIES